MILLTHATQLLTVRGGHGPRRGAQMRELGIIEDGAVLILDGRIAAAGTTDEIAKHELLKSAKAQGRAVEEIDCRGKVVLPGFVDSHTHPVFAAPRLIDFEQRIAGASYEQIAAAGGGIRSSIKGVREASVEALAAKALAAFDTMAAYGTTTVEAKSGYGLSVESELKSLRAIAQAADQWPGTVVPTLLAAHVVPPEYRENADEYVRIVCGEMIPYVAQELVDGASGSYKLAQFVDVFCERGAFTPEQTLRILRAGTEQGLGVRAHVSQLTAVELAPILEFHPASLDHLDQTSDADIALLAKYDTIATLLPAANYFLGLATFPPARRMIDAGAAVAVATDYNPGTAPTVSMPFVLSAACTHMKMSPAEAIVAATWNGACALRLQHRKGSLEPGKDADLAIFNASDYRELAYWFGMNLCDATIMGGTKIP